MTPIDKLDTDDIESDIKKDDITNVVEGTGVGNRKEINILKDDETWRPIQLDNTNNNIDENGNSYSGSGSGTQASVSPTVMLLRVEAPVAAQCGTGEVAQTQSFGGNICYTCNGSSYCSHINRANCRIYALNIYPPVGSGLTLSSATVTFNGTIPDYHISRSNTWQTSDGSVSFQGKTYYPDTCVSGNTNCENGVGTANNFFTYTGNSLLFRFRPSNSEYGGQTVPSGKTISGTVNVTYSDGSSGNKDFSYNVVDCGN